MVQGRKEYEIAVLKCTGDTDCSKNIEVLIIRNITTQLIIMLLACRSSMLLAS